MDIRYKLYPYPVLAQHMDDYLGSSFEAEISPKYDAYNVRIGFLAKLNNDEMKNLISKGDLIFAYHLECAQTGFRTIYTTRNTSFACSIPHAKVRGRLQICPFIVAKKDLLEYTNSDFHEDYRGFKFSIDAGCIMGFGSQRNVDIDWEMNELSNTPSVFVIIKNDDETATGMVVDMDKRKIVIKLHEKEFANYKILSRLADIQAVLNSMVIIPSLTFVLEEVARREPEERYEYSTYAWYIAIRKALMKRLTVDIESNQFADANMIELAQKLVNAPIEEALDVLCGGYVSELYEEEE